MTQQRKISNGLDRRLAQVNEFDESGVFEIRMPLDFKLGKNEVKLKLLPNKLLKGSDVLVDIFDSTGNIVLYEFSKVANEDTSRSIIVSIFEDTASGNCKIYIGATLANDMSYLCILNQNVVPTQETNEEIKFSEPPVVQFTEKLLQTQNFTSQTRKTERLNSSGYVSVLPNLAPKQQVSDQFSVEKREAAKEEFSTNVNSNIGSGSSFSVPSYLPNGILTSRNFPFSASMEGGTVIVNGISLEVPNDNISSTSLFSNHSWSGSVQKVVGTGSVEIYPSFLKTVEYQTNTGTKTATFDRFTNQQNFTCSFNELLTISNSTYSQSYAVFEVGGLESEKGKVDSIEVSYKSLNQLGSVYQPLGSFKVEPVNLLTDSASVSFKNPDGIIETPIGSFPNGVTDFNNYWVTQSLGLNVPTASRSSNVADGIKLSYEYRPSTGSFFVLRPKPQFQINSLASKNKFTLKFNSFSEADIPNQPSQLDFYISGSNVSPTIPLERLNLPPIVSSSLGTYVGSVSENNGRKREINVEFQVDDGTFQPVFVSRAGKWHLGSIEVKPKSESGFNPKQTKIFAPMNLPTGSEVNFKLDYLNPSGKKYQGASTVLEGVFFQGSTIRTGGGTTTIPPGTVSGSDQLTGSYDGRYERKGTGILSGSAQIAPDISGSFTSISSSITNRVFSLEQTSGSLNAFTGSATTRFNNIENTTGSLNVFSGSAISRLARLELTSGSLNNYTGSNNTRLNTIEQTTGSLNTFSGSANARLNSIEIRTGSYATTGSNQFNGNQSVSGTFVASGSGRVLDTLTVGSSANTGLKFEVNGNGAGMLLDRSDDEPFIILAKSNTYTSQIRGIDGGGLKITGPLASNVWAKFSPTGRLGVGKDNNSYSVDISGSANIDVNLTVSGSLIANKATGSFSGSFHGQYSSSQQVDYNQITNKPVLATPGQYRLISSDGTVSGSIANPSASFITSSSMGRLRLSNMSEWERMVSSSFHSSEITYVTQSFFTFTVGANPIFIKFPIFRENDGFTPISSSTYNASYAIRVETTVYGITGSLTAPKDTHMWATTAEFKSMLNSTIGATPIFSTAVTVNDSVNGYGSIGQTFAGRVDLSSWFATSTIAFSAPDLLSVRYIMSPTGSAGATNWNFYLLSSCRVLKNEIRSS